MIEHWTLRVCAILLSITLIATSWSDFQENRSFTKSGRQALVEPIVGYTEMTTTKTNFGIKVGESKSHSAEIFFTTLDNQRIKVNQHLPDDVLAAFQAGSPVYIEYLPQSPVTARFVGHPAKPALSGFFALATIVLTAIFWRKM